ncbi:hypothetical protein KCU88_g50, partial [Aureobasidium melanogenum]
MVLGICVGELFFGVELRPSFFENVRNSGVMAGFCLVNCASAWAMRSSRSRMMDLASRAISSLVAISCCGFRSAAAQHVRKGGSWSIQEAQSYLEECSRLVVQEYPAELSCHRHFSICATNASPSMPCKRPLTNKSLAILPKIQARNKLCAFFGCPFCHYGPGQTWILSRVVERSCLCATAELRTTTDTLLFTESTVVRGRLEPKLEASCTRRAGGVAPRWHNRQL